MYSEADVHGSSSDLRREHLGRDEPQVIEIVQVEDLQVHGLRAGVAEAGSVDDLVDEPAGRVPRSCSGSWPIAAAARYSASSLPTHTTTATV